MREDVENDWCATGREVNEMCGKGMEMNGELLLVVVVRGQGMKGEGKEREVGLGKR